MHPAGFTPPRQDEMAEPLPAALILHLAHELRQPLSGIESAAYYLDMMVSQARPDLLPHCRRLRALVQHANWLLDDATLCTLLQPAEKEGLVLEEILSQVSRRMLAEDEAVLDVYVESGGRVEAPGALPRLIEHTVAFFRDVAGCRDPIHAVVQGGQDWIAARLWAEGCEDPADAARGLRAASECGFLGRFLAAAGGTFEVEADEPAQRLSFTLRLRAAQQGE